MDKVDVIVIGAGVVGLAIAAEITEQYPQLASPCLTKNNSLVGTRQAATAKSSTPECIIRQTA